MTTEKQIEKIFKKHKKKICKNTGWILVNFDTYKAYDDLEADIKNLMVK